MRAIRLLRSVPGHGFISRPTKRRRVEAIADRIIPPDPQTPGGKDAGCGVYLDRQLAGPYGRNEGLYNVGPFQKGTKSQGPQSSTTRAELYRKALAALDRHCRSKFGGKRFAELSDADKDAVLHDLDEEKLKFDDADAQGVLRPNPERRAARVFCRSDLRRQSRHGRVENDRLSRRALQLSRLDRSP